MQILLHGEDTFRSQEYLDQLIDRFKQKQDQQGLNVVKLDAENKKSGELEEQIFASPFLSEKRLVVLNNFLTSDHEELKEKLVDKIKEDSLPDSTVLVFWENETEPNDKLSKELRELLAEQDYSQKFPKLEGAKLKGWIKNKLEERETDINRQALNFLVKHVGSDMWQLNNVLDQLIAYTEQGTITIDEVQIFVEENVKDDIFDLIDAIVEQKPKEVYNMIREQYRSGNTPHYLFAMILRQFRIIMQIKDAMNRGLNPKGKSFANKMDLHPYVLKKTKPIANKYSQDQIENIYDKLLELDQNMKTGQHEPELLVDFFVGGLCRS